MTKTYARDKFIEVYLRLLAGDDLSKKRRSRDKVRLTLDLPETYRQHDRNGDGFLTPRELHQAEKEKALLEKASTPQPATRTAPTVRVFRSR